MSDYDDEINLSQVKKINWKRLIEFFILITNLCNECMLRKIAFFYFYKNENLHKNVATIDSLNKSSYQTVAKQRKTFSLFLSDNINKYSVFINTLFFFIINSRHLSLVCFYYCTLKKSKCATIFPNNTGRGNKKAKLFVSFY